MRHQASSNIGQKKGTTNDTTSIQTCFLLFSIETKLFFKEGRVWKPDAVLSRWGSEKSNFYGFLRLLAVIKQIMIIRIMTLWFGQMFF